MAAGRFDECVLLRLEVTRTGRQGAVFQIFLRKDKWDLHRIRSIGKPDAFDSSYENIYDGSVTSFAQNGVKLSVGYAFAKALGWQAINIEGNARVFDRLVRSRPDAVNVQAVLCQSPQEMHFIDARRNAKAAGILEFMPDNFVAEAYGMKGYRKVGGRTGPKNSTLLYEFEGLDASKCNVTIVNCVTFASVATALNLKVVDLWILVSSSI
jgi:hypothetical protein